MAEKHIISGNVIDDDHPIAVEQQGELIVKDGLEVAIEAGTEVALAAGSEVAVNSLPAITGAVTAYVLATPGLTASREGRAFCSKLNKKTGINAAATVLTDAGMLKATVAGYRDVVTCFYSHLNTDTDWCEFELVVTANADGSGDVTALSPLFRIESPANKEQEDASLTQVYPPLVVTPAMGGAWTIRAQTNDADASVTFGVNGWREPIPA